MIRRIVQYIICIVMCNFLLFLKEIDCEENKISVFEEYLNENGIKGVLNENVEVIFDYDCLDRYLDDAFDKYEIEKYSKKSFSVKIKVSKGIFYKEIEEYFYISEGDLYVG